MKGGTLLLITKNQAEQVVLGALASGSPPFRLLAQPQYARELCTRFDEADGTLTMEIDKRGFRRYKRRYPYPAYPPPAVDCQKLLDAFNEFFQLHGLEVATVTDCGKWIQIQIRRDLDEQF